MDSWLVLIVELACECWENSCAARLWSKNCRGLLLLQLCVSTGFKEEWIMIWFLFDSELNKNYGWVEQNINWPWHQLVQNWLKVVHELLPTHGRVQTRSLKKLQVSTCIQLVPTKHPWWLVISAGWNYNSCLEAK